MKPSLKNTGRRRGNVLVLTAIMMVAMFAMLAFAIDVGYVLVVRTEIQRAADAGALAGAGAIGQQSAEDVIRKYVELNLVGNHQLVDAAVQVEWGDWNPDTKKFTLNAVSPSGVRVSLTNLDQPMFFAKIVGQDAFDTQAQAIAAFQPRDVLLVLDFSGSMSYDSQFRQIDALGQPAIEANLLEIYTQLNSPVLGNMQWTPQYISSTNTTTILNTLGLNGVPYPYPGGSWSGYFSYVRNDDFVSDAGYYKKYGYMTWVNYLLSEQAQYNQTPDLWQTSQQPVTALKDAVDVLAEYLDEHAPHDQLGLSVYTSANGTAILESGLTDDFLGVADIVRHRQAGHYQPWTNIYDGMKTGRLELEAHARPGAQKYMLLMTDGQANRPGTGSTPKSKALEEAQNAANANIKVVTVAVGAGADTDLMEQIAEITDGLCFIIPGGQTVAEYEAQLQDVFEEIAGDRRPVLVK